MLRRIALAAVGLTMTSAIYFAVKQGAAWVQRGWSPREEEFDRFAAEVGAAIPPDARVRVVTPRGQQGTKYALLLNARLYPRVVVTEGPADWIVELPDEEFVRSRASFRRAEP